MKTILVFGAGKSATCLIDYFKMEAPVHHWQLLVADSNLALARSKVGDATYARAIAVDITDAVERNRLIRSADIVISLLPPSLHILIAHSCVEESKHLLTASYADEHIKKLDEEIKKKDLLFLCEMGLDPGIDHMSAMQIINNIQKRGGTISSFYSHCGGLVAPESDDNPWHYKISWNPRNIVLAGKAGAIYKKNGQVVQVPYSQLFLDNATVSLPGVGTYAWYPNRDSLAYAALYQLQEAHTFIRTTLRHPDFCAGWSKVVDMGLTDEALTLDTDNITYADFTDKQARKNATSHPTVLQKQLLSFLGLYDEKLIAGGNQSGADIVQGLLENKLMLRPTDKDMIIMLHEFEYLLHATPQKISSYLVVKGENNLRTAMAKTVGLPLAIAAKLILENKIQLTGVHIPILPAIYEPVLAALSSEGISFTEF